MKSRSAGRRHCRRFETLHSCLILIFFLLATLSLVGSSSIDRPQAIDSANHEGSGTEPLSHRLFRRNVGGRIKDYFMMKYTKNFYCNKDGRVIPVDPFQGLARNMMLRKRSWLFNDDKEDHGICHDPTWIKLEGWDYPIPMKQAMLQYPEIFRDPKEVQAENEAAKKKAAAAAAAGPSISPPGRMLPFGTPPGMMPVPPGGIPLTGMPMPMPMLMPMPMRGFPAVVPLGYQGAPQPATFGPRPPSAFGVQPMGLPGLQPSGGVTAPQTGLVGPQMMGTQLSSSTGARSAGGAGPQQVGVSEVQETSESSTGTGPASPNSGLSTTGQTGPV